MATMDFNDLAWRLGLATSNIEMQRALEAFRAPSESRLSLDQSRAYMEFAALTSSAQVAAEMKSLTDVATFDRLALVSVDAARFQAQEMMDWRATIEAAKSGMGLEQKLAALRPDRSLEELFAAARQPLELDYLVREVAVMKQHVESVIGRDRFEVERVLESLRQGFRPIGVFELPDILESDERRQDEEDRADILLPEDAHDRLVRVEFLPVRVIQEIRRRPEMMRKLTPREFEEMTAELLNGLGFEDIILTPPSRDGGRDVIAVRRIHGIPLLFAFECKQYTKRRVQLESLRGLLGTIVYGPSTANIGVLVTTSTFTSGARQFILSEARIDGKDFDDLVGWLGEYGRR
ncbi:MAG: hypothetical protein A3A44_03435 [Candidatus Sungbacteria bacterium RIFCSPLOWO2_01_FULL_60_25]|uniref:Restriction endonuclease type IV Mrr domain-containing protein n=1 Tax=Candidatus Sungbacteria bacterium RIFCSPLOWO2_01_FULL_60_25 TaxID=1802281 RepID=A0A1G2LEU0_9BACT|nr:MAG: hypothetical protein A3A44_03435 [Candidatus Sungbacteria bacterium RIFCSPLOWO2_01_FULL_60_25]